MNPFPGHVSLYNPDLVALYDRFTVTGDSIASGVGDDGVDVIVDIRTAYNLEVNSGIGLYENRRLDERFAIGGQSAWTHFGQYWAALTGRRSIWSSYAKSSSSISKDTWKYHWDYSHVEWLGEVLGGHMLVEPAGSQYAEVEATWETYMPQQYRGKKYLIYAGGSFDAGALRSGLVTEKHVTDKLIQSFEWWRDNRGYDDMLIVESGVIGQTEAEVLADQTSPTGRDMEGLRRAQNAACAHDRIHNIFAHAADPGDPFNTLTVDANGLWVSGHENFDASGHYSGAMSKAIGKTAAHNLAVIEDYISGEVI